MSSRVHRKNIIYDLYDGCWEYSSKMYYTKNYDKTAKSKHERKQIASSSKDPPPRNLEYDIYTSLQTKIKLIVNIDNPI
jgi:hypothetical protein